MPCALGSCPLNVDTISCWAWAYIGVVGRICTSGIGQGDWVNCSLDSGTRSIYKLWYLLIYINDFRTQMTENNKWTGGQSHAQPLVLPEIFDGDESFTDWLCHFESIYLLLMDGVMTGKAHVMGKAHMAYSRLSHETQQSYEATKEALNQRFEPPSKQQLYKASSRADKGETRSLGLILAMICCYLLVRVFPVYRTKPERS